MAKRWPIVVGVVALLAVLVVLWWPSPETSPPSARASAPPITPMERRSSLDDEPRSNPAAPSRPMTRSGAQAASAAAPPVTPPTAPDAAGWAALHDRLEEMHLSTWLEKNADVAERTVENFCAEAQSLKQHPLFPPTARQRDASAFLAPLVGWEASPSRPAVAGRLDLPAPLAARLRALKPDAWVTELTADDTLGLDFLWLEQLQQFDHWNVSNDVRLGADETANWYTTSIPTFSHLQSWAKLRLVMSFARGDWLKAAAEVRHLAALCTSTELLIGAMVGNALLSVQNTARQAALARGLEVSEWPEVADAQRTAYRRLGVPGIQYFFPGVSPRVMKRAAECHPVLCAALAEGLATTAAFGSFASTDSQPTLEALLSASSCAAGNIALARRAKAMDVRDVREAMGLDDASPLSRFLPPDAGAR